MIYNNKHQQNTKDISKSNKHYCNTTDWTGIQCQNWREFDTQQKRYAYIIIAYLLIISQVISSISAKKIIKIQLNKNKISKFGIF